VNPACLVVLFGGLAFYEYDENTFWPYFAKAVGSNPMLPNQQRDITGAFSKAAEMLGLIIQRRERTYYVGSAVYHIGVPLSLWDGFLEVCEWALWREDWRTLSEQEWIDAIEKRTLSRVRLRRFLIDNREAASSFIQELLEAREILTNDQNLTISEIGQASILRMEYFEEVPETAEFLRPENPESLFQDRARIIWNDQKQQISLYLPAVKSDKLPAIWKVGGQTQKAAATPDELLLNSAAFRKPLLLSLESGRYKETQRLQGLESWGLFDLEAGGRRVNSNRDELPLKSYVLISQRKIANLARQGFDEEENPTNEQCDLADGTTCFATRLWPNGEYAELKLTEPDDLTKAIRFRTRSRIKAQFFVDEGCKAAWFQRVPGDRVKVEKLPDLYVSVPRGYFKDDLADLNHKFKVFMDTMLAGGQWTHRFSQKDNERRVYLWQWIKPFIEPKPGVGVLKDFGHLSSAYRSPDLKGEHTLSIAAPDLSFKVQYQIYLDHSKAGMDQCWEDLPGPYLLWFLLCQSREGLSWEELMLARELIAPDTLVSYYLLRKYADHGFFLQKGRKWLIKESRAAGRPIGQVTLFVSWVLLLIKSLPS